MEHGRRKKSRRTLRMTCGGVKDDWDDNDDADYADENDDDADDGCLTRSATAADTSI